MKKLIFKVWVEDLDDKIYREIEISDEMTLASLAYVILASFNTLAYHLYDIKYNGETYDCNVAVDEYRSELKDATKVLLKDIKFDDSEMIMDYDFGSTNTFIIKYIGSDDNNIKDYMHIKDGKGSGIIDDISSYNLKDIVEEIDLNGKSNIFYTGGYEEDEMYDYRKYDINLDNKRLPALYKKIKKGYEDN